MLMTTGPEATSSGLLNNVPVAVTVSAADGSEPLNACMYSMAELWGVGVLYCTALREWGSFVLERTEEQAHHCNHVLFVERDAFSDSAKPSCCKTDNSSRPIVKTCKPLGEMLPGIPRSPP